MSLCSVWLCSPQGVCAQDVALDMSACHDPAPGVVRALVSVELRDRLLPADASPPAGVQVVDVRCTRDEAELGVRGTEERKTVALSSVPAELRARLLALSVAELARPQPRAAVPVAPVAPVEPPRSLPAEPRLATPTYLLWAGLEVQATPLLGLGGSLLLRAKMHDFWAWSSAVSLAQASSAIDRGELRVLQASLRTGLAFLLESSRASLQVGAGVRGGWLRLSGEPASSELTAAARFSAWYLGPALFAAVTFRVASPVFVALELELTCALREVRANVEGGSARTLSPWRSSGVLGAGVAW